jgi:hypothetical protein
VCYLFRANIFFVFLPDLSSSLLSRRDSIVDFSSSVSGASSKDVMDLLVLNQYFDTLQTVGNNPNSKVVFVASDQSEMSTSIMQAQAAAGRTMMVPMPVK